MGACEDCLLYFICEEHSPNNDDQIKDCFEGLEIETEEEDENNSLDSIVWEEMSYRRHQVLNPSWIFDELNFYDDESDWDTYISENPKTPKYKPNLYKYDYIGSRED